MQVIKINKMKIEKKYHFYMGHRNKKAGVKCGRLHGHTYDVKCIFNFNEEIGNNGLTMLFSDIDKLAEPIIKQFSAKKLLLLFKKRIAQLVDLDIQEIDQIFKIKFTKEGIKNTTPRSNRIPISTTRRYCLFTILEPGIADETDQEMFLSEKIDDQLARAIIEISIGENKKNTASIMHLLSNRFDQEIIGQLQTQLASFDQTMDIDQEVDALRLSIKKKHLSASKRTVLDQIKQKSLQSLTDEEKKFLRNMGKS